MDMVFEKGNKWIFKKGQQAHNKGISHSLDWKNKISIALTGKPKSEIHKTKLRIAAIKQYQDPKQRQMVSERRLGTPMNFSEQETKRRSQLFKTNNPMHNPESKEKNRISASISLKTFYNTPQGKVIQRERRAKVVYPRKDTKPERTLQQALTELNISFEKHKTIRLSNGSNHAADIFIQPNIIIEADGNYWHNRPDQKAKDEYINQDLQTKGYKVYRFWESEITGRKKQCIPTLKGGALCENNGNN